MLNTTQKTTDFSFFSYLPGNRDINHTHVKKLIASISQRNLLKENPILVTSNFEVIDGQHRLEAAKALNLPVYYTVISASSLKEVLLLNNAQLSWTLMDYVNSYRSLGLQEYEKLYQFVQNHDIPVSLAVQLLTGNDRVSRWGNVAKMKQGKFVAKNMDFALEVTDKLKIFIDYVPRVILRSRGFIFAIAALVEKKTVDWEIMKRKLGTAPHQLHYALDKKDYLYQLEKIYNYDNTKPKRIF